MQQQNTAKSIRAVPLRDGTYQGYWLNENVFLYDNEMIVPVDGKHIGRVDVSVHVLNSKAIVEVK